MKYLGTIMVIVVLATFAFAVYEGVHGFNPSHLPEGYTMMCGTDGWKTWRDPDGFTSSSDRSKFRMQVVRGAWRWKRYNEKPRPQRPDYQWEECE